MSIDCNMNTPQVDIRKVGTLPIVDNKVVSILPLTAEDKKLFVKNYVISFDSQLAAEIVIRKKTGLSKVEPFVCRSVANDILKDSGIGKKLKEWVSKNVDADTIKYEAYKFLMQVIDERAKAKALEINAKIYGIYSDVNVHNEYNLTWSQIVQSGYKENRMKGFAEPAKVKEITDGTAD